ncbi:SUKH-3 domain-containing protein [Streptomyces sp. NPDC002055]|uniref:SUKH-3 domain-containing protein n=1 Tax=Streptomyces sp. NPDC002055 TaxID=3154534 RepID=UPI003330F2BA
MDAESQDPVLSLDPGTVAALEASGWHPGRRVDVSAEVQALEARGYVTSRTVLGFLESFSGLRVEPVNEQGPNFINGEPFIADPVGVGNRHQDEAVAIGSALNGAWFPIGWWLSYSHVFMERSGALVACANGLIWSLGDTPLAGLDFMVRADRPLVCVHAPAGVRPWPDSV